MLDLVPKEVKVASEGKSFQVSRQGKRTEKSHLPQDWPAQDRPAIIHEAEVVQGLWTLLKHQK